MARMSKKIILINGDPFVLFWVDLRKIKLEHYYAGIAGTENLRENVPYAQYLECPVEIRFTLISRFHIPNMMCPARAVQRSRAVAADVSWL